MRCLHPDIKIAYERKKKKKKKPGFVLKRPRSLKTKKPQDLIGQQLMTKPPNKSNVSNFHCMGANFVFPDELW